jgi:cell division protein FtsL
LPFALVLAVGLFVWTYYPVARVQYRETRERARLAAELGALKARNARLSKQVEKLKTPEGVEDYARSQLGLVKRGENVVVVVDGNESIPSTQVALAMAQRPHIDSDETTTGPVGPWTGFLDVVFGVE